jgi:hypothetical protein
LRRKTHIRGLNSTTVGTHAEQAPLTFDARIEGRDDEASVLMVVLTICLTAFGCSSDSSSFSAGDIDATPTGTIAGASWTLTQGVVEVSAFEEAKLSVGSTTKLQRVTASHRRRHESDSRFQASSASIG